MEPRIVIRQTGAEPHSEEFPVNSTVEVVLGREADCQVRIPEDRWSTVSRHHARIAVVQQDPLKLQISDLNSSNGTLLNGQKLTAPADLKPGDRIQLGSGGPEFEVGLAGVAETMVIDPRATRVISTPPTNVTIPPPVISAAQTSGSPSRRLILYGGAALAAEGLITTGLWYAGRGTGVAAIKVFHQRLLISGAYKAYANPEASGGRYWFARVVIKNTGKASLKNVKVSYQVPDYLPWTSPDEVPEILPGATSVFIFYPKFSSKLTQLRTRTPAVLETKVEYNDGAGVQTKLEKREFEFFGLTEFSYTSMPESEQATYWDSWDNDPLLAAYVHDEDPVVKTFYAKISEASGGMDVMSKGDSLLKLIKSTYNYMVSLGMTYSGAKGVPDSTGDVASLVQSIRVPRDLIFGNSGLCIELALLWCSIAQAAGAKAYMVLIPGHAFPVLGADDGTQYAVEATAIGGGRGGNLDKAATWEDALKIGAKEFNQNKGQPKTEILDMASLQGQGIRPPELPMVDIPELSKLLDDRRAKRAPRYPTPAQKEKWFFFFRP